MEDKKLLLWYSDARASAGRPLSLMSPCCVPWGPTVPSFLPMRWVPFCVLRNHLYCPREWVHRGKPRKLCCAKWWCRGEPSGALLRGPACCGVVTAPVHPPMSWLLSLQLFVPLPEVRGIPAPAPDISAASQAHLEPLAAPFLVVGALSKPSCGSSLAFPVPLTASHRWDVEWESDAPLHVPGTSSLPRDSQRVLPSKAWSWLVTECPL